MMLFFMNNNQTKKIKMWNLSQSPISAISVKQNNTEKYMLSLLKFVQINLYRENMKKGGSNKKKNREKQTNLCLNRF